MPSGLVVQSLVPKTTSQKYAKAEKNTPNTALQSADTTLSSNNESWMRKQSTTMC